MLKSHGFLGKIRAKDSSEDSPKICAKIREILLKSRHILKEGRFKEGHYAF